MKIVLAFGPLFVIIAALLWSFDGLLRISLYTLPPAVIVFYEHMLGSLVLVMLSVKWFKDLIKMTRKEWTAIIIVAVFSGVVGTTLYTSALGMVNYTQYSVVVLLQQLQPIWAIAAAAILLHEKITKRFLFWTILALVSAYLITFKDLRPDLTTGADTLMAGLFALSAGFMWGTSTAVSKYVLKKVTFLTSTALRFLLATFFAFLLVLGQGKTSSLSSITLPQLETLLLITFSTGMVAVAFYYYGLKRTPARITTLCELVWPASAIFIDYFLFHKTLSPTQIFGVILLLFTIYQITKQSGTNRKDFANYQSPSIT